MWWLCFERDGQLFAVAIVEAPTLSAARTRATLAELGGGGSFKEGYPLDARCQALLAPEEIGRMLSLQEAAALTKRFKDSATKSPATSIRRLRQMRRADRAE
jgi:hypothetical protein